MKTSSRIRPNRSAARPSPQGKTPPVKNVTVIFYCEEDDSEMARVELPEVLLAAVQRAAKKMKITAGRFFELAVANKIDREISIPATGGAR
ncbi:MAG TPA: hypothetical protein VHY30_10350 [Verrucomicrobiae bacterium]|jgi:hypothetical protein|nr:hypothetical protein [Verrucomicrobiae bacterium]